VLSIIKLYFFSSPASLFPNPEGGLPGRPTRPGREVPAWVVRPVGSTDLFQKQLSKHCIRAYKEIYTGIDDEAFEAIPIDTSNYQSYASPIMTEVTQEKTSNSEIEMKPAASFTAKINELTSHNLRLITELEQWKSATSQAETLNRELEASLEAAQSDANAIQQENERMKEACRQNSLAANCFRAKTA
jgi:hypothetical protein